MWYLIRWCELMTYWTSQGCSEERARELTEAEIGVKP